MVDATFDLARDVSGVEAAVGVSGFHFRQNAAVKAADAVFDGMAEGVAVVDVEDRVPAAVPLVVVLDRPASVIPLRGEADVQPCERRLEPRRNLMQRHCSP